ncbi:ammonium transporter [Coraliomargarita sp. SDUM461004]|uniref:Ammonium transporter n=1 Tax=Thalassobacterium sedimentorum TaxID=3041258 RepID=A0ABU1AMG5_9BACT|nr:ammonium transporter [Coraliomargarita sp. SDUM461004]MDQ8195984.1 ammonium transporter [Coraliomargarita sp. SDUM461004]
MSSESLDIAWMIMAAALVMAMQVGFCFLESGLVRAKNSINVAIKNLADFCVSAVIFWLIGFGLMFGSSQWGLFGTQFFLFQTDQGWWLTAFFIFQLVFCSTAITIISGAVAERMRFNAYLIITIFTSGLVYPFFGHWAWAGVIPNTQNGWLLDLGFLDFAGSTVVHAVGGWVSLAAILVIGPRHGQYANPKRKIQGHNLTLASAGVIILWFGWIGFNGGSTLQFNSEVPKVIANTIISGAFGGVSAMLAAFFYYKQTRTWALMNGIIGGLVSITSCCNVVTAGSAALIGIIAGALCFCGMLLLNKLKIDDAVGAVSAHAFCGVWGSLAVALLGESELWSTGFSRSHQLLAQIIGSATCFLWSFGSSYVFFKVLNKFVKLRVSIEEEQAGLNVTEHGATTELIDLITDMNQQQRAGSFSKRVHVEPHTEVGQIAAEYNRVLERIEEEFRQREIATQNARKSQTEAIHANQVKSDFLANMSHELRTPLGIIMGYIELIQEDIKDGQSFVDPEDLTTISDAGHHLLHLINGVLDISKIESGKIDVNITSVNVYSLIQKLEQTVLPLIGENKNQLHIEIADGIGSIQTDEIKLQQCLLNLISNAAKFTDNGHITLRAYRRNNSDNLEYCYFEVEDTGIGIQHTQTKTIFQAFTQADSSTTRQYGGTGLGLTITQSFCQILGGEISLSSDYGKGSCFTMRIPS